jgi:hypothetical protein
LSLSNFGSQQVVGEDLLKTEISTFARSIHQHGTEDDEGYRLLDILLFGQEVELLLLQRSGRNSNNTDSKSSATLYLKSRNKNVQ